MDQYQLSNFIKLVTLNDQKKPTGIVDPTLKEAAATEVLTTEVEINLLVGAAIGYATVFRDVINNSLSNPTLLPKSDSYDSVLSVGVLPAQPLIGQEQELIVGTYGQRLLAYREQIKFDEDGNIDYTYSLSWQRIVSHPVYCNLIGDFSGNGIFELIVSTLYGVHFFQFIESMKTRTILLQEIIDLQNQILALSAFTPPIEATRPIRNPLKTSSSDK